MPLFARKHPLDITATAYARWLRAGRPPFDDFLRMSDVDQEGLATLGDNHHEDLCVALATALTNPEALVTGSQAGDAAEPPEDAIEIARKMANSVTMGGTGGSRYVRPQSQRPMGTMLGAKGERVQ